jgi:hypothetical protein
VAEYDVVDDPRGSPDAVEESVGHRSADVVDPDLVREHGNPGLGALVL